MLSPQPESLPFYLLTRGKPHPKEYCWIRAGGGSPEDIKPITRLPPLSSAILKENEFSILLAWEKEAWWLWVIGMTTRREDALLRPITNSILIAHTDECFLRGLMIAALEGELGACLDEHVDFDASEHGFTVNDVSGLRMALIAMARPEQTVQNNNWSTLSGMALVQDKLVDYLIKSSLPRDPAYFLIIRLEDNENPNAATEYSVHYQASERLDGSREDKKKSFLSVVRQLTEQLMQLSPLSNLRKLFSPLSRPDD